ncbi:MAG: hypothetical protein AB7H77_02020 [Bdellovibrionales bacterium]
MPSVTPSSAYASDDDASALSSVAWAAIFGGALTTIGIGFILSPLGAAAGLGALSPWEPRDMDAAKAVTAMGAIWFVLVQWIASGVGGYITGRMRTRWFGAHQNEVFFRDTAHGFLSWATATAIGAAVMAGLVAHAASGAASAAGNPGNMRMAEAYYTDTLFRTGQPATEITRDDRSEAARILARGVATGEMPAGDRNYLSQLISSRTGISPAEADQRITDAINGQKEAMEKARKVGMVTALVVCLSLLIGALIASAAAALGGMHRDEHYSTGVIGIVTRR